MSLVFERFEELSLCQICALPLPRTADNNICSRRCAGLRKLSSEVLGPQQTEWRARILQSLSTLKPGTTICPGELSVNLLSGVEKPLTVLRPLLYQMAEEGRVVLSQKNVKTHWWKIRGPFRIRRA